MCRREGPAVEQFARDTAESLQLVGLGTQDSLDYAVSFVEATGTRSFPMLWDPSFESWVHFGVPGQPAGVLLDADGFVIDGWLGPIPEDRVLDTIAGLS